MLEAAAAWVSPVEPSTTSLLLWRGQGQAANVSLLGSIHALTDPSVPPEIERTFEEAEGVIFESDVTQFDRSVTLLPEGSSLRALLSPQTYELLTRGADDLGLDVAELDGLTIPGCFARLSVTALERGGFDFGVGIDTRLRHRTDEEGKLPGFLERPEAPLHAIGQLPLTVQERFLTSTLIMLPKAAGWVRATEAAWRTGDLEKLARALPLLEMRQEVPEISGALLAARNQLWAARLAEAMPFPRSVLVVVGCAHFIEPEGLLSLLEARGYSFTRARLG